MKETKAQIKKKLHSDMVARAFELRQMTGRGWTREQLFSDPTWKELNDKLVELESKNNESNKSTNQKSVG